MNIDGKTKLLGLIGTPVEHSKSPAMYNYCFDKYGLNCAYLAFDVDMEHVADGIAALRTFNVMGCNVTMPLKNLPNLERPSRTDIGPSFLMGPRTGRRVEQYGSRRDFCFNDCDSILLIR